MVPVHRADGAGLVRGWRRPAYQWRDDGAVRRAYGARMAPSGVPMARGRRRPACQWRADGAESASGWREICGRTVPNWREDGTELAGEQRRIGGLPAPH